MKKKVRLYVRTPQKGNEFSICDEITDDVLATTSDQKLAVVIKNALEYHLNNCE